MVISPSVIRYKEKTLKKAMFRKDNFYLLKFVQ
ncbi:hypothetical protein EZS27_020881 [termite gut metagenome]|uniref:Uncharacterized protein n=1 Tax=termite gut metagenome TaxID=433724 RepID=A0A5J4R9K9_9ZZZZ